MATVRLIFVVGVLYCSAMINCKEIFKAHGVNNHQAEKPEEKANSNDNKETEVPPGIANDSLSISTDKSSDNFKQQELHHPETTKLSSSSRKRRSDSSYDLINSDSKRQGFNAMRGRRDQGFSAMRGRRDQGFSAMRGRSVSDYSDLEESSIQAGFSAMRGRRDQGFSAMRGRRDQGFNAMRGRRDQGFNAMRGRRNPGYNAMRGRRDQGFSAMRGRRVSEEDDVKESNIQAEFSATRGKRAPISSDRYIIIRGRREDRASELSSLEHSEPVSMKRAAFNPSSGSFSAMRGKKDAKMMA